MSLIVRDMAVLREQPTAHHLAVLSKAVSAPLLGAAVAPYQRPGQRWRKLPLSTVLLLVLAMSLYTQDALAVVYWRLVGGLHRWRTPTDSGLVSRSALCQGRARLGVRPVVALFHQVARPLATAETAGAVLWGLPLLALDGTKEVVPDTPANARAFGRPSNQRGDAAYPQVLGVYLVEVGTHAVLDAGFWPCRTSEHLGGRRLLRSLPPNSLLLMDAGFYSWALLARAQARGAQVLGRFPAGVRLRVARTLPDGTVLGYVYPSETARRQHRDGRLVRVLTYQITDPARPHAGEVQRLVTTLLDPVAYPALDLICAYHERWEVELTIDELDTHQRLAQHPLRSQTPLGVLQELYGLLVVHYALRSLMLEAATTRGVDPDRVSFTRTVQLVTKSLPEFQATSPAAWPALRALLLADLTASLLPPRAPRANPRVIKRQRSKFARKRPEHRGLPPLATPFRAAVVLLPAPATTPLPSPPPALPSLP